jgi:hypothetical protein
MFVVFHTEFPHQDKRYFQTHAGARRSATCSNRHLDRESYKVLSEVDFAREYPVGTKWVKNLMTGQMMEISSDTPRCCDPSTEAYWSM